MYVNLHIHVDQSWTATLLYFWLNIAFFKSYFLFLCLGFNEAQEKQKYHLSSKHIKVIMLKMARCDLIDAHSGLKKQCRTILGDVYSLDA